MSILSQFKDAVRAVATPKKSAPIVPPAATEKKAGGPAGDGGAAGLAGPRKKCAPADRLQAGDGPDEPEQSGERERAQQRQFPATHEAAGNAQPGHDLRPGRTAAALEGKMVMKARVSRQTRYARALRASATRRVDCSTGREVRAMRGGRSGGAGVRPQAWTGLQRERLELLRPDDPLSPRGGTEAAPAAVRAVQQKRAPQERQRPVHPHKPRGAGAFNR